jgi:hypothetical protein
MPGGDTDLDRYAGPDTDPRRLAERRELLIDQLAWLIDEAAALGPLLAGLPEWALSQTALPGERSVKSALARIAALDRGPRTDWLRALAAGREELTREEPAVDEAGVADERLDALLDDVRSSRADLVALLRAVPEASWQNPASLDGTPGTLFDVAMSIARDDADELRGLAYRLHDAGIASS